MINYKIKSLNPAVSKKARSTPKQKYVIHKHSDNIPALRKNRVQFNLGEAEKLLDSMYCTLIARK
jgi:hypothetical protein